MKKIPYHERPLLDPPQVPWIEGEEVRFHDGRAVQAYRLEGLPGIGLRLLCPLPDGTESVLVFRVSDEAALALADLILRKLTSP